MQYHYFYISKQVNTGTIGVTYNDTKVSDLNAGNKIRAIMLRQYSEAAGKPRLIDQSAGASLARIGDNSNIGIFRHRVKLNGNEKFRMQHVDLREHNRQQFGSFSARIPTGYSVIDWADRGFLETAFDTRGFGAAAVRWEYFADALNLVSTDRLDILQIEQVPVEV